MEFKEIVKERYATKQFDSEKKISEDKLNELLEIIRFSPSSFNIQPWKIIVISNQEIKDKLFPASYNQPQVKDCSHLLVFCADKNIMENIELLEKEMISGGAKPEEVSDYLEMMSGFASQLPEEQKTLWAQKQIYIALGNAVNGSKSLGFDSCPMEGFSPKDYSEILELPENLTPTLVCPLGYALSESDKKPKMRFSKDKVFQFIK